MGRGASKVNGGGVAGGGTAKGGKITQADLAKMSIKKFDDYLNTLLTRSKRNELEAKGLNGRSDTQALVDALGWHDKPTVLDDDTFDKVARQSGAVVMHRGVHTEKSRNNTMYSDASYMGDGVYGDGLYFSTKKRTASSYAGGRGDGSNKMSAMLDMSKSKIVDYSDIRGEAFSLEVKSRYVNAMENTSLLAIKKGYNVIRCKNAGGTGDDYYVVLDRSALIFREDSLVK